MKFRIFGFRTPYALVVLVLVNFIICNVFEKKVWKEIQSIVDTLLCDSALVRSFKQTDNCSRSAVEGQKMMKTVLKDQGS